MKHLIASALVALTGLLGFSEARAATLVGQEASCSLTGAAAAPFTCSPSTFTITSGGTAPDAQLKLAPFGPLLDIFFTDNWVDVVFSGGASASVAGVTFGSPISLIISGLLPASGAETSLSNLSISGVPGLDQSDFTLSGGVLGINLSSSDWSRANNSAVRFQVVAVPLPAGLTLLLTGIAGLGGIMIRRKRRALV